MIRIASDTAIEQAVRLGHAHDSETAKSDDIDWSAVRRGPDRDSINAYELSDENDSARGALTYDATLEDKELRFKDLTTEWKTATAFSSSLDEIAMHPSYQRIIGMGAVAVPLILRELEEEPDHWFWALAAITEEDPVTDEERGDIEAMTTAWLTWGKRQGLV